MLRTIIVQVVCSFLLWLSLYSASWYRNKHRTSEWSDRFVTLIHGLIVTFLSGYIALIDGPWPLTHPGHPNTTAQINLFCLSLGYFIFDFGWCVHCNSEDELMIYHHILSICGMGGVLLLGQSGSEVNAIIFVSEITNPLLQIRWFLRDTGHYPSIAGDVVDALFVLLFLGLRIIGGVWIVDAVVTSSKPYWEVKVCVLTMYFVSVVFMWDICSFARRKLMSKYHSWRNERNRGKDSKSNGHVMAH